MICRWRGTRSSGAAHRAVAMMMMATYDIVVEGYEKTLQ